MNLRELKKDIANKVNHPLYMFTGDEIAIRKIYTQKIVDNFEGSVVNADSLDEIIPKLKTNSLLMSKKCLFIIYDDKTVLTADKIWEDLKTGKFQKGHTLIFIFNSLDKRSKFYKEFSNVITVFDYVSPNILLKYVNKELSLTDGRAEDLIYFCQNDYNKILIEMDKIRNCAEGYSCSDDDAFDYCFNAGLINMPPDGEIFDLLNAILARNIDDTYYQFKKLISRGDSPLAVLSLLHTNLKAVLQVQCSEGMRDIGKVTGLNGFQIQNARPFIDKYSEDELVRMIKLTRLCEQSIKQTGMLDADIALDFLFVKIF